MFCLILERRMVRLLLSVIGVIISLVWGIIVFWGFGITVVVYRKVCKKKVVNII